MIVREKKKNCKGRHSVLKSDFSCYVSFQNLLDKLQGYKQVPLRVWCWHPSFHGKPDNFSKDKTLSAKIKNKRKSPLEFFQRTKGSLRIRGKKLSCKNAKCIKLIAGVLG